MVVQLRKELWDLKDQLYAQRDQSLLVVLQGVAGAGKCSTIKHCFYGVGLQGVRVTEFKAPTALEAAHDFLWRAHRATPAKGELAIWHRSHYEDVLTARVHQLASDDEIAARFEDIVHFETLLRRSGTTIVKIWLDISKKAQRKSLDERGKSKKWKLTKADQDELERWDDYQVAYADALKLTSVAAPWARIDADKKAPKTQAVLELLVSSMKGMGLSYPS